MTHTEPVTWALSTRDGRVHAFTTRRWCGDAIALCQHPCPPQHTDCSGRGLRCTPCLDATLPPPHRVC